MTLEVLSRHQWDRNVNLFSLYSGIHNMSVYFTVIGVLKIVLETGKGG